jgi:hypothetical protein
LSNQELIMRNVFVFTRVNKYNAQWFMSLHGPSNQPLFTPADANEIRRFWDPEIAMKTFTVEAVSARSRGPLIVRRDDYFQNLHLDDHIPTDLDLERSIILDDVSLWEAYEIASQAQAKAEEAVIKNLRKPSRAEIRELPAPTPVELGALACLYVAERLRASRKPDPGIVALASAHITAGSPEIAEATPPKGVPTHGNEELFTIDWSAAISSKMSKTLYSKGWLSHAGEGIFTISQRAQQWLNAAVKKTP